MSDQQGQISLDTAVLNVLEFEREGHPTEGWCSITDVMQGAVGDWGRIPARQSVQLTLERLTSEGKAERREVRVGLRGANRYYWRVLRS